MPTPRKTLSRCFSIDPGQPGVISKADSAAWFEQAHAHCREVKLQKFALKMLLTSLTVRRRSGRIRGVEVVTTLLTLALLVAVGVYIWAHGGY